MRCIRSRKKPWRRLKRISQSSLNSQLIRRVCCSVLVLELAFFARGYSEKGPVRVDSGVQHFFEEKMPEDAEAARQGEKTYGFDIRFRDGIIEFYRKEEFKSTN